MLKDKIEKAQKIICDLGLKGWLLYDFKGSNNLARSFLMLDEKIHLTRRFFYFIPQKGWPVAIIHSVDASNLEDLYGIKKIYTSLDDLDHLLKHYLDSGSVAMEYSPHANLPYLSKVDAGTVEKITSCGVLVVSSAPLLQYFGSILTSDQKDSHLKAAQILLKAFDEAIEFIDQNLQNNITEFDVALFIFNYLESRGYTTDHLPIVAVNANSSIAHYAPTKEVSQKIKPHDFILIDMWCKLKKEGAIYADICRVATIKRKPTKKEQEVFDVVFQAQKAAIDYLKDNKKAMGCDVDKAARSVVENFGFGPYFTHRTGHNIYTSCHGDGAHIDGFETKDTRTLLANTCFSIEPGIYLANEFGIRLETDILIDENENILVTAGLQDHIIEI